MVSAYIAIYPHYTLSLRCFKSNTSLSHIFPRFLELLILCLPTRMVVRTSEAKLYFRFFSSQSTHIARMWDCFSIKLYFFMKSAISRPFWKEFWFMMILMFSRTYSLIYFKFSKSILQVSVSLNFGQKYLTIFRAI